MQKQNPKYQIPEEKITQPCKKMSLDIKSDMKENKCITSKQVVVHCLITCLGSLYFGYAMGELNLAQNKLNLVYNISEDQQSTYQGILNSAMLLGAFFGSLVTGSLLKSHGRRPLILLADLVGVLSCLLFLIANFWVATIARFIMGLVVGLNSTIIPLYVREVSPSSVLPKTEILNQTFLSLGILVAYLIGLGFPTDQQELEEQSGFYWRFNLLFPVVPLTIRGICFMFIYKEDTIFYFLNKGLNDKAKQIIQMYYEPQIVDKIFYNFNEEIQNKKKLDNSWSYIFKKIYIGRTILGCLIFVFLQFSGINAFVFYSSDIFEDTLGSRTTANVMTLICGVEMVILAFLSSRVSQKYGRKKIFLYGQILLGGINIMAGIVSYIIKDDGDNIALAPSILIISAIFLYYFVFSLTIGPLSWVYAAEIHSNENAIGLATGINWLSSFTIGLIFPILTDSLGVYSVFWIFAGFCIVGFFYFFIFAKETRHLSGEQIRKLFENQKQKQQQQKQQTQYLEKSIEQIENISNKDNIAKKDMDDYQLETKQQLVTQNQIQTNQSLKNLQTPINMVIN